MFQNPPPLLASKPNQRRIHQHHESKEWVRLPADQKCFEPLGKPFLETAFGKVPPEVRSYIFKDVLTVESPLKDGISVTMTRPKLECPERGIETKPSMRQASPASCLALLQTCRQIYQESSLLFYSINTMHFSDPHELLRFLHHLGPVRCNEIQSLHLEHFSPRPILAGCKDSSPADQEAMRLLNKTGKIRKLYLDMGFVYNPNYVELCMQIPGLASCEIAFESLTRWSVRPPSSKWETCPWLLTHFCEFMREPRNFKLRNTYLLLNEKCRVEVDIHRALPEERLPSNETNGRIQGSRSVDKAMEDLYLSL